MGLRSAVLALMLTAGGAAAAPPAPPIIHGASAELAAAEQAWTAAAATTDATAAPAAWQAAAQAFTVAAARTTGADRTEALYAAVLAWKQALAVDVRVQPAPGSPPPSTLGPAEAGLVDAIDRYLPVARADEQAALAFTRGMVFHRHGQHAVADSIMAAIVAQHPDEEVAEYAADVLLDSLNQQGKFDELVAWVARMRADRRLQARRPELAALLERLHAQALSKRAEEFAAAGQAGDAAAYGRCAATYRQILRDAPRAADRDKALYNAAVCDERAGDVAGARAALRRLVKQHPRSALVPNARARLKALRRVR